MLDLRSKVQNNGGGVTAVGQTRKGEDHIFSLIEEKKEESQKGARF